MTTSIEEALRSGAVRLVPVEATGEMLQAVITANRAETGLLIPISFECAAGQMAYKAMLSASPDHTPALVALIEERDRLKVERDRAVSAFAEGNYLDAHKRVPDVYQHALALAVEQFRKAEARALAAEAKCDALREALAAEREACAAFVEAEAKHLPGGVCDLKATCRYLANEIRARALTQETADVGE